MGRLFDEAGCPSRTRPQTMPVGTVFSSPDTVGVAVVNYPAPVLESRDAVLDNCRALADYVAVTKRGYPGLDLIVFPEYSTQGFHPTRWQELTVDCPGAETAILADACRRHAVWGVFSLTGERNPDGNPWNTCIVVDAAGDIVLRYRKILPWCPQEPWFPGDRTMVVEGPKGLRLGTIICYDGDVPEIVRDTVAKGAELVVRIQGYMYPNREQQRLVAQVRALDNLAYVAVANLAGRDLTYSYFGHSCIVDFDGRMLAECSTVPGEVQYAVLSVSAIRDARRHWRSENHLFNLLHRGSTAVPGGVARCPLEFYTLWVQDPERARALIEESSEIRPRTKPHR